MTPDNDAMRALEELCLSFKISTSHDITDSPAVITIRTALLKSAQADVLVSALEELTELQESALCLEKRANGIRAPEDKHIRQLCERYGYGAVMDSAARQWFLNGGGGGAHTTYHCFSVVKSATKKAKQALHKFSATEV